MFENDSLPEPAGSMHEHWGSMVDTTVGWQFNPNEAAELEMGFAGAGSNNMPGLALDNPRVANVPVLANFTFSLSRPGGRMVPYFGAGAGGDDIILAPDGFGQVTPSVFGGESDVVFAWQAFAGWRFNMSKRTSLGFGYKYFATGDPAFTSAPNPPAGFDGVRSHSLLLTFHLKF